jgi:CubicO group peptidase (beta-lactamase class C family)
MRACLAFLLSLGLAAGCTSMPTPDPRTDALDHALAALVADPQHPVVSVSALAIRDGQTVYANQFGARHVGSHPGEAALPVTEHTLFRVASISKLVVSLGVFRLVEQGLLRLDDDVSTLLGWQLRHPQFPDRPITLRLLLSHRSGLSDGGESYAFDGRTRLQDVLQSGGRLYQDGQNWRRDREPGTAFEYVNLNFGVIATVMERATGERFDRLMQRLVLDPLGLRGGFNPADFPAADQADIATQYRKRRTVGEREIWDPAGPWIVQADDFRHAPPSAPPGLDAYEIGSNGTLFGPQGRLRISLRDLGIVLQMLLDHGMHQGRPFLSAASIELLSSEQWRMNAARSNGDASQDWALSWGLGVQRFTDSSGPGRGDRLVEGGGFTGWGHTGDAYGLMGVFALDPQRRQGLIVLLTGPGTDPALYPSQWSALYRWEEIAVSAVHRHVLRPPPNR